MKYEKKMGKSIAYGFKSFSELFLNNDLKDICDGIFYENGIIGASEKYRDGRYIKAALNDGINYESSIAVTDSTIVIVIKKEFQTSIYRISLGPELVKVVIEERPNGYIVDEEKYYYSSSHDEEKKVISKIESQRYVFKEETINKLLSKTSGRPSMEDFRDFYVKYLHQFPEKDADLVTKFVASFEPISNLYMIKSNNYKQSNNVLIQTSLKTKDGITNYSNISDIYKCIKKDDALNAIYGLYMGEVNYSNFDIYPKIVNGMISDSIENLYYDRFVPEINACYGDIENKLVGLSKVKQTKDYKNKIDKYLILNSQIIDFDDKEEEYVRS